MMGWLGLTGRPSLCQSQKEAITYSVRDSGGFLCLRSDKGLFLLSDNVTDDAILIFKALAAIVMRALH